MDFTCDPVPGPFTPGIMPFLGFTRILSLYLGQTHYREKDELVNDPAWSTARLPKNSQESAYIWVMQTSMERIGQT